MEVVNCILHKLHTVSTIEGALTEELNISDRNFEIKNIGKRYLVSGFIQEVLLNLLKRTLLADVPYFPHH